ncbi:hypothetical protein L3V82_07600 [Thiotrichales bacterium 19S3-7]|nr:hypothetical protein [Thiotrichales bacterium 19S3-7]MCF6802022.1 hypothetical protein [Thiotrichales bacterium 19S3-11]
MPFSCMSNNQPSDDTVREWDRYSRQLRELHAQLDSIGNRHPIIYQEPRSTTDEFAKNSAKLACAVLKNNIQASGKDNWKLTSARLASISQLIDTYTIDFERAHETFMSNTSDQGNHRQLELAAYRLKEAYLTAIEACQIAITQNRGKRDSKATERQEVINGLIGRIEFSHPRLNQLLERAESATMSADSGFQNLCSLHMAMKEKIASTYASSAGLFVFHRQETRNADIAFLQSFTEHAQNDQQRLGVLLLVHDNIDSRNSALKKAIKETIEQQFPSIKVGEDNRANSSYKQQARTFMQENASLVIPPEHLREASLSYAS